MSERFDMRMAEWREQIDSRLHKIIDSTEYPQEFKEILDYAVFPGGKRLRPILFLEWHSLAMPPDENALTFACGLELMHCFSLIHDDMPCIDNDDIRRGKPTVHKKYGDGKALLAGDALQDLAYASMIESCAQKKHAAYYLSLLRGDTGIIHGQYLDLYVNSDSTDKLLAMYRKKTGALIEAACTSGYMFALEMNVDLGSQSGDALPLGGAMTYGMDFGVAFQIYDDLSEYIAGESVSGTSILEFVNLDEAKIMLNGYLNNAVSALDYSHYAGDTSYLRELTEKFIIV